MPPSDLFKSPRVRHLGALLQQQMHGFTDEEILLALVGTLGGFCLTTYQPPRPPVIEDLLYLFAFRLAAAPAKKKR